MKRVTIPILARVVIDSELHPLASSDALPVAKGAKRLWRNPQSVNLAANSGRPELRQFITSDREKCVPLGLNVTAGQRRDQSFKSKRISVLAFG